jgi:hypothetical protein
LPLIRPGEAQAPDGWSAPEAITNAVTPAGLAGEPIGWYHPRHTQWLLAHRAELLPPASFLAMLTGATLATDRGGKLRVANTTTGFSYVSHTHTQLR